MRSPARSPSPRRGCRMTWPKRRANTWRCNTQRAWTLRPCPPGCAAMTHTSPARRPPARRAPSPPASGEPIMYMESFALLIDDVRVECRTATLWPRTPRYDELIYEDAAGVEHRVFVTRDFTVTRQIGRVVGLQVTTCPPDDTTVPSVHDGTYPP